MSKVIYVPPADCWLMTGGLDRDGYAHFSYEGQSRPAHRIAWRLFRGEITDGMLVCHSCDVPCCVNPNHLFLGTQAENMADMTRKGRIGNRGHPKLTRADVERIGELRSIGRKAKEIAPLFGVTPERIWQLFPGG